MPWAALGAALAVALFAAGNGARAEGANLLAAPPGATTCSGCHGAAGAVVAAPALSGQAAPAVAATLLDYKAGRLSPNVMTRITKGFSDEELRAIAAWVTE